MPAATSIETVGDPGGNSIGRPNAPATGNPQPTRRSADSPPDRGADSPPDRGAVASAPRRRGAAALRILALALALLAAAVVSCSDDDSADEMGGGLGVVRVAPGDAIQIRALLHTSDENRGGYGNLRVVRLAVEHYGPIRGFAVHVGEPVDDYCSPDGGRGAAETIVADKSVIGVIGPSCSTAASQAAPLLSAAGMVAISPSNTSPALTSDLAGNPNEHYDPAYYRTAHNDLYQAEAVARFLYEQKGLTRAATIHDGDVYTKSLADAFVTAFSRLGGAITDTAEVSQAGIDVEGPLTEIADHAPQALFLSLDEDAATKVVQLVPDVGLRDVVLIGGDGLIGDRFLVHPETEGMFFSGPVSGFGDNRNQSTGRSAVQIIADYETWRGEVPNNVFWGHAYDATTLLLEAIEASSRPDGDSLVIDRAGVREFLDSVVDYEGIIGSITCDAFGDCGVPRISVVRHQNADDIPATRDNVVYEYTP